MFRRYWRRLLLGVLIVIGLFLAASVVRASAAGECQFPETACGTVIGIANVPGRYSYAVTTGGSAWITDASRGYWGAGIGKFCCLYYVYGSSGRADLHCSRSSGKAAGKASMIMREEPEPETVKVEPGEPNAVHEGEAAWLSPMFFVKTKYIVIDQGVWSYWIFGQWFENDPVYPIGWFSDIEVTFKVFDFMLIPLASGVVQRRCKLVFLDGSRIASDAFCWPGYEHFIPLVLRE